MSEVSAIAVAVVCMAMFVPLGWLFFDDMPRWRLPKKKPAQSTKCFCPSCKVDLCSAPGTTITQNTSTSIVRYECGACGWPSRWNFDDLVPMCLSEPVATKFSAEEPYR